MESRVSIQNNSPAQIPPKKKLNELIDRICGTLADNQSGIELVFMNDEQIRPYYKEYFGEDRATDVIAFPMEEDGPGSLHGCIAISIETAERQAEEHGHSLWEEVRFLIIHGFLHLLGYDHGEPEEKRVMQAKEQELLALTESI